MNMQFGSGVLYGLPNAGNLPTNPTPFKFGVLQDASIEFKGDLKKLYGTKQFPVAKARGKIDVSCKAKIATVDPNFLNQLFFAQSASAGVTTLAADEAATVPATPGPYTVAVANHTHFVTDYGVCYVANGQQMTKVAAAPALGQYACDGAGNYTFAAADQGVAVTISYTYTDSTSGTTISLTNENMGYAPEFRALLFSNFRNKRVGIELFSCTMGQMSVPTKQEDFWMLDITFDAGVDANGNLGAIYADNA